MKTSTKTTQLLTAIDNELKAQLQKDLAAFKAKQVQKPLLRQAA